LRQSLVKRLPVASSFPLQPSGLMSLPSSWIWAGAGPDKNLSLHRSWCSSSKSVGVPVHFPVWSLIVVTWLIWV
jgi:hypothetical protein